MDGIHGRILMKVCMFNIGLWITVRSQMIGKLLMLWQFLWKVAWMILEITSLDSLTSLIVKILEKYWTQKYFGQQQNFVTLHMVLR